MTISFLDRCRFSPTAGSTTDWTVSAAVSGYQTPASAGAGNTKTYRYAAESADLSQWEVGVGVYTVSSTVLSRATVLYNSSATGTGAGQSGAGTKINFSTVPQVGMGMMLAEDCGPLTLANATLQAAPSNPTATSSGVGVMMGLGTTCTLTPIYSTRILIAFSMNASNSAATGSPEPQAYFGTGTAPANAAATTGTAIGTRMKPQSVAGGAIVPVTIVAQVTGLTVGTAYWFDINLLSGGGTSTIIDVAFTAIEF